MNNKTEITILLPLPPTAGWKGEGIAETIENIIKHTDDITYHLIIGRHLLKEISEGELGAKIKAGTLTLTPVGWYSKKIDFRTNRRIKRLSLLFFQFSFFTFLLKEFIKKILCIPQAKIVWSPIPMMGIFGKLIGKKLILSFWDPFVFEYSGFDMIQKYTIFNYMKAGLKISDIIITQSSVNRNFLIDFLDIDQEKVNLIENGSNDYRQFIINKNINKENINTYWGTNFQLDVGNKWYLKILFLFIFQKPTWSKVQKELNRCVLHRLITKTSHKDSKIIVVSTQYRPYKGFGNLFKVFDKVVENYGNSFDFKFVFTGAVPGFLFEKYPWSYGCVFEMSRLTTEQHAYIYAISDLAIHPSFVEGGLGTYPMFESASINVPSLSHMGRHMLELESGSNKSLEVISIDLLEVDNTEKTIMNMLTNDALRVKNIELINSIRFKWEDTGHKYTKLFKSFTHVA